MPRAGRTDFLPAAVSIVSARVGRDAVIRMSEWVKILARKIRYSWREVLAFGPTAAGAIGETVARAPLVADAGTDQMPYEAVPALPQGLWSR